MKLNNRGMTLIEVLVCMAIVSAVVISMFNVIMTYQTEETSEALRSEFVEYRNIVTKVLQDDVYNNELRNVILKSSRDTLEDGVTSMQYKFILYFNKGFRANSGTLYYTKELVISANSVSANGNYIMYQDFNADDSINPTTGRRKNPMQNVRYYLPQENTSCTTNGSESGVTLEEAEGVSDWKTLTNPMCNISSITAIDTYLNMDKAAAGVDGTNCEDKDDDIQNALSTGGTTKAEIKSSYCYGYNYFNLDITLSNSSVGSDYHVKVVAPLNYRFCKTTE